MQRMLLVLHASRTNKAKTNACFDRLTESSH